MTAGHPTRDSSARPSLVRRAAAQLRLSSWFYLGLHAPALRRSYPECRVRAAAGREPDLVRALVALYRGAPALEPGRVEAINFRCAAITPASTGGKFFLKQFPRNHTLHDLERALRCSRVDRAWRAAHLLPRLQILTPRPVGTARARAVEGRVVEYLATEWVHDALSYHLRLRGVGEEAGRTALLEEFASHLRHWHDCGIYLRDLVTNVLTRRAGDRLEYWLTDLDQLHPIRRITRGRVLHQMRQLARWSGPLNPEEARAIVLSYLGRARGGFAEQIAEALLATLPAPVE